MKSKIAVIAVALVAMLTIEGCSSSRKAVSPTTETSTLAARYAALDSASKQWSDVNVAFTVTITKPSDFAISGRMKMMSGRGVDISLRLLGIEMARILVTTDSIYGTYRLKKTYVAEPIAAAGADMPQLLSRLQDLLMGRAFVLGETEAVGGKLPPFSSFQAEEAGEMMALVPTERAGNFSYAFFVDGDNHLTTVEAISPEVGTATVKYSGFTTTEAGTLPRSEQIDVTAGETVVNATLDWKWSGARWNAGLEPEWTTPRGYRRVTLNELFGVILKK